MSGPWDGEKVKEGKEAPGGEQIKGFFTDARVKFSNSNLALIVERTTK